MGPYGDTLKYDTSLPSSSNASALNSQSRYHHSGPTVAVTESDGVRIIGPDVCDMVQKVPSEWQPSYSCVSL